MTVLVGIDFALDGKQSGHLAIPHSSHLSAYGKIVVPVVYIRNGDGPRALVSAGVHGDEFEGQIAARKLCIDLSPDQMRGSLLVVPMANAPAALSSSRISPIDQLNLNRSFPGNPLGSPTAVIANAIENELLANCDYAFDIHSGGSSLFYTDIGITTATGSVTEDEKRLNLLKSLGLDAGMLLPAVGSMGFESSADGAMLRKNVIGVSAEFGGGGHLSSNVTRRCEESIRGFLAHTGLMPEPAEAPGKPCRFYDVSDPGAQVYSDCSGIFMADVAIGELCGQGDPIGRIFDFYDVMAPPKVIRNKIPGRVLAIRSLPRVEVGDCLAQVGKLVRV
ncbi:putative deacylase [Pararhizobium capsulatum DSM 1112]|uniref:Deacylase n=1 Tax=Pararhizobium capsulatum DSM 1112 TaxID=1121113 RepID=A0ABU0C0B0_9HYPH|nr:succinylglutamate desuccinylase/aspartoacylase family protein [Pararhizobium capsulatum]MDQ0323955.1 putative deacylase [Pararhizobium capsulatum DSM 1112]